MALREYESKRDFQRTPEPAPPPVKSRARRKTAALQFVIQKHAASRLHYDFRLEHDGALKSWAVPKGPSINPAVKSLAVEVEDHPLEYGSFEGSIPDGEYGAGEVIVWDHGTWIPDGDVERGLRAGKLKFTLKGEKLKGSWTLVRMAGRRAADGRQWLLMKAKDEFSSADPSLDPITQRPESVLSGKELG